MKQISSPSLGFLDNRYVRLNPTANQVIDGKTLTIQTPTEFNEALILRSTDDDVTKNLFEAQKADGTVYTSIAADGTPTIMRSTSNVSLVFDTPSVGQQYNIEFQDSGSSKWAWYKDTSHNLNFYNYTAGIGDQLFLGFSTGRTGILTNAPTASLDVRTRLTTEIGVVIRAASSQSANTLEIQNSSSGVMANFSALGRLQIDVPTATSEALILKTTDDDTTKNLFEAKASDDSNLVQIDPTGQLHIKTSTVVGLIVERAGNVAFRLINDGSNAWNFQMTATTSTPANAFVIRGEGDSTPSADRFVVASDGDVAIGLVGADPSAQLHVVNNIPSDVGFLVQAAASQSANITEWQDSSDNVLTNITKDGHLAMTPQTDAVNVVDIKDSSSNQVLLVDTTNRRIGLNGTPTTRAFEIYDNGAATAIVRMIGTNLASDVVVEGGAADVSIGFGTFGTFSDHNFYFTTGGAGRLGIDDATGGRITISSQATTDDNNVDARLHVFVNDSTEKGLIVKGAASQSANQTEWQDSNGAVGALVNSDLEFSNPNGQTTAEVFGDGATASATSGHAFGNSATAGDRGTAMGQGASAGQQGVSIGRNSTADNSRAVSIGESTTAATDSVAIGSGVTAANANVVIGRGATDNAVASSVVIGNVATATGQQSVVIGQGAVQGGQRGVIVGRASDAGGFDGVLIMGSGLTATAAKQWLVGGGSSNTDITQAYFGSGITSTFARDITFNASGGSGTDVAGGGFIFAGGKGTGTGVGGDLIFQTAPPAGGTGSSLNALVERMRISDNGAVLITNTTTTTIPFTVKGASSQSANLQEWQTSSGTKKAVIGAGGDWAIGDGTTVTTSRKINLFVTYASVGVNSYGQYNTVSVGESGAGNSIREFVAFRYQAQTASGYDGNLTHATGGIKGATGLATHVGSGTVTAATGFVFAVSNTGSGTITNAYRGLITTGVNSGGGTITNNYGLFIQDQNIGGTINSAITTNAGNVSFNAGGDANTDLIMAGDSISDLFKVDSGNDQVETHGGRIVNTTEIDDGDSPYTALATDNVIFCDTDGGAITLNLLAGSEGHHLKIINVGTSGNDVTVDPDGSEELFGGGAGVSFALEDVEVINIHFNSTEGWF